MFFTGLGRDKDKQRSKEAAQASRKAQERRDATAAVASQVKAAASTQKRRFTGEDFSETVPASPVITDLKDLPTGKYLPFADAGIPRNYETSFALLTVATDQVVMLRNPDSLFSRAEYEMGRRCTSHGLKVAERLVVSNDILSILHNQHYQERGEDQSVPDTDVQRNAFALIEAAVEAGASDIHLETRGLKTDVFFRIHGERFPQPIQDTDKAKAIMRVLYNVHSDSQNAGTQWVPAEVQDTAIVHKLSNGVQVQLRFNSAPIYPGENIQCTLRVLRMDGQSAKQMEEVGYTPAQVAEIQEMLVGSTGLVLLVGPTNSGKSTSLQAFIKRIYDRRGQTIKVVTIEDPVEYIIERACQMGVPRGRKTEEEIKAYYKKLLGSTLRQDPDVALVGEIRTNEQAEPVKDMVLAGRKILSTLHAYEAMTVFSRLSEIGIPRSLLTRSGFVSGIIYQRLVPVLCPGCKEKLSPDLVAQGRISAQTYNRVLAVGEEGVFVRHAKGCDKCGYTSIVGRTPCAEILVPDETFLRLVRQDDEVGAKNHWHRTGINTGGYGVRAIAHAIFKMKNGEVDPNDVEVQIGKIEVDRPEREPTAPSYGSDLDSGIDDDLLHGLGGRNSAFVNLEPARSAHQ